ncbi:PD40 domain-containing protein [Marivirga sp. S37H4]|uniref:PD40 domain-containing protein n=1 Tax=Marivirga aurantiaca TaxID=2802615 RepID=A0A934WXK9_9BACT|nr:OmpA family protein [Marivirga aurantiaca]MBK6265008.1 PD40 domain-containing protein [Marivirga aurantiaca]
MIKKLFVLLPICILLASVLTQAQSFKRKTEKLIQKSKEALYQRNWNDAVSYMDQAVESDSDNFLVHLEKASLHYNAGNLNEVVSSLQLAFQRNQEWPAKYHDFYFVLGKEMFDKGKYEEARQPLNIYQEKGYNKEFVQLSEVILESIDFAAKQLKEKGGNTYDIRSIESGNIFRSVYFPFFTLYPTEFLYFTGQRTSQMEEGIYRAKLDGNKFQKVEQVPVINTNENEGAAAISADGRVMVFTSCNRQGGYGSCDLYISYSENGKWQKPENLGANINSSAWESQPFLSSDGRLLIFSSNRKGGIGKRDLYFSRKQAGAWTPAENLGEPINTFADEISPFLSLSNDTLFFSSNGKVGMGGFDIYKASWDNRKTKPENIGYPINTFTDEISYHQKFDGSRYWSRELASDIKYPPSNIFYFHEEERIAEDVRLVYGYVKDAENNKPLHAKVQIYDLVKDTLVHETGTDQSNGLYKIIIPEQSEYSFYVEAENYLFESKQISVESESRQQVDFQLNRLKKGQSITLNNIYFEFDSYELNEKSHNEIRKIAAFLKENLSIQIEIAGYTDQKGTAAYNQKLSEQRAQSVYDALVEVGVSSNQITSKGYGAKPQPNGEYAKTVRLVIL